MFTRLDYNVFLIIFIYSRVCFATLYEGDNCSLKDGNVGTCKLITNCPYAIELIKTQVYPVVCGFLGKQSIVCCNNEDEKKQATSTTETTQISQLLETTNNTQIPTQATVTNRTPGYISKQKCKEYAQYAYETILSPVLTITPQYVKILECDLHRVDLVVGSSVATRREFPHMALIGYKNDEEFSWQCGGSLISENFILTAAHCLDTPYWGPAVLVRLGLTNKTDPRHMQERTVSEIIPYTEYTRGRYHDIGLLRLSKDVEFNLYVRPACLYTEKNIPNEKAIVSGWGAIEFSGGGTNDLLKVVLEFFSAEKCNNSYRRYISPKLKHGIVDDLMICAGSTDELQLKNSSCSGDSGGPLQLYHNETEDVKCMYDIVGVISFGKSCGLGKNQPTVHTRVSRYIKWIEDIVWPN